MYETILEYLVSESMEAKRLLGSCVEDAQTTLKGAPFGQNGIICIRKKNYRSGLK